MLRLRFGKSQSSLLLIVAMVSAFVILWLFFGFKQLSVGERLMKKGKLSKLYAYVNTAKGFSRQSLLLSVHAATSLIARNGGDTNPTGFPRTWICNGADTSPSVEEVRFFLSNKTLQLLNDYVKNFRIKDLPKVELTKFKCVDYDVSEESVFSGRNDENFNVGAYGSNLTVSYKGDSITSGNDVYDTILQNRFWYLYRGFKKWVSTDALKLEQCLCKCTSLVCECGWVNGGCGEECKAFYDCALKCVKSAAEDLNKTFDEYVSCDGQITCCVVGSGDLCKDLPRGCIPWLNPPDCYGCPKEDAGKLCSQEYIPKYGANDEECKGTCLSWWYGKSAVMGNFFCEDKKYALSTEGERTLKFNVGFTHSRMVRCEITEECGCYENKCKCPELESPFRWCVESCEGKCE